MQAYWGVAMDAGFQEVLGEALGSGFTAGGGIGFGLVRMADVTGAFPRILLAVGWSF